jgi:8-oxo-dGTP pyrophosphatase MutT (NUDIX family)
MARETSAGAVVFRKAENKTLFLLLHYTAGHWDFPKGNIESGEEDHETVRREIKEETGITDVTFIEQFKESIRYAYTWKGLYINKVVRYYLAETKELKVKISHEHQGFEWLPFDAALERITHDNSKEILTKSKTLLDRL